MTEEERKVKLDLASEVTPEYLEATQQILAFVKEGADELAQQAKERKLSRQKEVVELRSGATIPYAHYISDNFQDYFPVFPNDNPFFSQMFRLAGWTDLNPNEYVKPDLAKLYLVEIVYYRFHKEIVPALRAKAIRGTTTKLFQRLTDEGIKKLIQFRDEAVEMMKKFPDGKMYEFRLAYAEEYKTDVQLWLLEPK